MGALKQPESPADPHLMNTRVKKIPTKYKKPAICCFVIMHTLLRGYCYATAVTADIYLHLYCNQIIGSILRAVKIQHHLLKGFTVTTHTHISFFSSQPNLTHANINQLNTIAWSPQLCETRFKSWYEWNALTSVSHQHVRFSYLPASVKFKISRRMRQRAAENIISSGYSELF